MGLGEALAGVETIIDAATGPSPDQEQATAFFTASARNLQRAGAAAGAKRIVVVSIIGIDKFHGGYNAAKVAQEQTLLEGPLPVRIVRAAQFHEFVEPLLGWMVQDGVAYVPEMRTQLVAARVVAETLADAAEEPEIENGRITEVAGPQPERFAAAAAAFFANRGDAVEIRESRGGPPAEADDPDAAAHAEGAALPNRARSSPGPASSSGSPRPRRSVGRLDEMKSFHEGELVTLVGEHEPLDGIVVHAPSLVKVEVAVPDSADGPVFRTVHPKQLRRRTEAGEQDDALRRLIRRTASAGRGGPRTGPGSARRGHSHPSGHRTTGK